MDHFWIGMVAGVALIVLIQVGWHKMGGFGDH